MTKYFACQTLWLQTGKPASRNKDSMRTGDHLRDTFLSVERGEVIPDEGFEHLTEKDITELLGRGQISTTAPEIFEPAEAENAVA